MGTERLRAAAVLAALVTAACSPQITSFRVDDVRPPANGDVMVIFEDGPLPRGFRALAVISADGAWNAFHNPPMLPAFVDEARRLGCTVLVAPHDGFGLTGIGRGPHGRRGEAMCGVIEAADACAAAPA